VQAPDVRSTGIATWHAPIGFAIDSYYNRSRSAVTIESASLIDPHNLVVHASLAYEMVHSLHILAEAAKWSNIGQEGQPAAWARRQAVPGAVIPPQDSAIAKPGPRARNLYEIVLDVSALTPQGGWAIGERLTYRAGGRQYAVRAYTGYAIAPPAPGDKFCQAQFRSIHRKFNMLRR
jgi:hypothetical protein